MKQLNFFIKTITTSSSYLSRTFFLSVFLLFAGIDEAVAAAPNKSMNAAGAIAKPCLPAVVQ